MSGSSEENMPPIDDNNLPPRRPAMDEIPVDNEEPSISTRARQPSPRPPRSYRSNNEQSSYNSYGSSYNSYGSSSRRMSPEAELLQAKIDKEIARHQMSIQDESWIKSYWRPAMGWLYMLICFVDFVLFPALTMILPAILRNFGVSADYEPWTSITLSNGGLIHLAFGAILGVAAWTRGQEKTGRNSN